MQGPTTPDHHLGGGTIHAKSGDGVAVSKSIIAFSTDGEGFDISAGTVSRCVVYGNADGDTVSGHPNNVYEDPLLCDIYSDNFSLCANSPCLADNNSWGELIGAYGQGCGDCDAVAEPVTWATVKQMFR